MSSEPTSDFAMVQRGLLSAALCLCMLAAFAESFTVLQGSKAYTALFRPRAKYCPYCDSSVYGYCSDKLLHDACCCSDPYALPLPRECKYADCSFLHANTCQEHQLITQCCCSNFVK